MEPKTEIYYDEDTNTASATTTLSKTSATTSDLMARPKYQPNRAERRKTEKLRLTKPLKYIRGKVWYGDVDVTEALENKIPVQTFVYITKKGYSLKDIENAVAR